MSNGQRGRYGLQGYLHRWDTYQVNPDCTGTVLVGGGKRQFSKPFGLEGLWR